MNTTKPYVKIDLAGPQGNAFVVLGMCQAAARQCCWTDEEVQEFMDKATSGDYENLLKVAREYFEIDNGDDEIEVYDDEYDMGYDDDDEKDRWVDMSS